MIQLYTVESLTDKIEKSLGAAQYLQKLPQPAAIAASKAMAENLTALDAVVIQTLIREIGTAEALEALSEDQGLGVIQGICDHLNSYAAIGIDLAKFSKADVDRCKPEFEAYAVSVAALHAALLKKPEVSDLDDPWGAPCNR
jgi:hypothetical protein